MMFQSGAALQAGNGDFSRWKRDERGVTAVEPVHPADSDPPDRIPTRRRELPLRAARQPVDDPPYSSDAQRTVVRGVVRSVR